MVGKAQWSPRPQRMRLSGNCHPSGMCDADGWLSQIGWLCVSLCEPLWVCVGVCWSLDSTTRTSYSGASALSWRFQCIFCCLFGADSMCAWCPSINITVWHAMLVTSYTFMRYTELLLFRCVIIYEQHERFGSIAVIKHTRRSRLTMEWLLRHSCLMSRRFFPSDANA